MNDTVKDIEEPNTATDWLIALRERPDDPALHRAFDAWRAASPENEIAWQEAENTASLLAALAPAQSGPAVPLPDLDRAPPPEKPRRTGRRLLAGAGLAFAALLTWAAADRFMPTGTHQTRTAATQEIELDDRSVITLAPDTAITVDYSETRRQVILHAGQAYFDVASNPSRPFVVQARDLTVTVLGTAFEVEARDGQRAVTVSEGIVSVLADGIDSTETLRAGDRLASMDTGGWARSGQRPDTVAAWRDNLLVANGARLDQVVADLSPYFGGYIVIAEGDLSGEKVTGVFDLRHPDKALAVMARSHGFQVRALSPWLLVVSRK
ncbi:MAG: FecR domain-containing protein [Alphaproteobacteria bacterium]|nr:FecR domain-containing protein [Alphaproteobacteria bacterium]MBO6863796.1 FecR domain-containing protein [Alphaproteobacteria bacterium]